jgi:hypothetical protein
VDFVRSSFFMGFDLKGPVETPQQVAESSRMNTNNIRTSFGSGDAFKLDPNYHKLADLLGLRDDERMDLDIAHKLSFLRDWTGETDEVDALLKIKQMSKELGLTTKGKELTKSLFVYARLINDRERIDKEISLVANREIERRNEEKAAKGEQKLKEAEQLKETKRIKEEAEAKAKEVAPPSPPPVKPVEPTPVQPVINIPNIL